MELDTSIKNLPTVTKSLEARLKTLGIETVKDLIFYFPFRYEDYARIVPIDSLKMGEKVSVRGVITLIAARRSWKRRGMITEILLSDDSGAIKIICFNQPFLSKIYSQGDEVYVAGVVRSALGGVGLQFTNPIIEKAKNELVHTARLVPIYPVTVGVTQRNLRFLIKKALACVAETLEWLPLEIIKKFNVPALHRSLIAIHFPDTQAHFERARFRFAFEELFIIQLRLAWRKIALHHEQSEVISFAEKDIKKFVASLPFKLTDDQRIASWDIIKNLGNSAPMNRLLQGDVGSGKTVVGAIACLNVARAKCQSAWLAPTEILARQHFHTLYSLYGSIKNISVALLTADSHEYFNGGLEKVTKKEVLSLIENGIVQVVVGTHALLQKLVVFKNLRFLIVDEQHRFGVRQRHALTVDNNLKDFVPHFLSMTATPIPRSLALTLYGDLHISSIKTMPAGRQPIISRVVPSGKREAAYQFIKNQILLGRQAYVVCPLIEPGLGEQTAAFGYQERKAVMDEYKRLHEQVFPNLKIEMLHGKMKPKEKQRVQEQFASGRIDILVSTTVVEVGIDVPNASVMIIEDAERFGLAQLHQLRGRVGRSSFQSYCFLFAEDASERVRERLEFFVKTTDGFKLAEQDLQWRGPGDVYGTLQSGFPELKFANFSDTRLIETVKTAVDEYIKKNPEPRTDSELYKHVQSIENLHLE